MDDDDDKGKMRKIIRELEIESQPHCTSKMCRELYKLTNVRAVMGPLIYKDAQGVQEEVDHDAVKYNAFLCFTCQD